MIDRIAEKVIEYLTSVSHELWWIGSGHHVLILVALATYLFLRKKGTSGHWVVTVQVIVLCCTVSFAAFRNSNYFNGIVFGALVFFWISEIALGRMAPDWNKVTHTRTILCIAVALWGFYYPHFIDNPYLAGLWRSPIGLVPCPTLMVILSWCVFAVPEHNHVVYWIMMGVGLFYGLAGMLMLWMWQDLPLIFIATYGLVLPLLPHHQTNEQERSNINMTTELENETE